MPSRITDVEGDWKVVDYPQHPESVGCKIEIKGQGFDPHMFTLQIKIINRLKCNLQYNSKKNQWKTSDFLKTEMIGPPEGIKKEHLFKNVIFNLQKLEVHNEKQLIIKTNDQEQIRLQRLL